MSNWDPATFEQEPQGNESVAQGDDRIRELKREIRYRDEVEHDFGTSHGPDDSGRHRLGSARAFFQSTAPTVLPFSDYDATLGGSGSGVDTLDDGRLWVDSLALRMWVRDQTDVSGLGVDWYPITGQQDQIQARGSLVTDLEIDATPLVTDITLSPSNPSVTIPASGTWEIIVELNGHYASITAAGYPGNITNAAVWILEDVDGGGAQIVNESYAVSLIEEPSAGQVFRPFSRTLRRTGVNGSVYTYSAQATRGTGALRVEINGSEPFGPTQLETHLVVTARPV